MWIRSPLIFLLIGDRTLCLDAIAPHFFTDRRSPLFLLPIDIDADLEADNLDRASRSLKTNIKFSKEIRLPEN